MTTATTIRTRAFLGDGVHELALTDPMLEELERLTGTGIGALYRQMADLRFAFPHVREVVRLALIGGGMSPVDALAKVDLYVSGRPLAETFPVALDALDARWNGVAVEQAEEAAA